jgi:hypothetical protein
MALGGKLTKEQRKKVRGVPVQGAVANFEEILAESLKNVGTGAGNIERAGRDTVGNAERAARDSVGTAERAVRDVIGSVFGSAAAKSKPLTATKRKSKPSRTTKAQDKRSAKVVAMKRKGIKKAVKKASKVKRAPSNVVAGRTGGGTGGNKNLKV